MKCQFGISYIPVCVCLCSPLPPDPGGSLRPPVLRLPAAGLSRAAGLPVGWSTRGPEPYQEETLHPAQRCWGQAWQGLLLLACCTLYFVSLVSFALLFVRDHAQQIYCTIATVHSWANCSLWSQVVSLSLALNTHSVVVVRWLFKWKSLSLKPQSWVWCFSPMRHLYSRINGYIINWNDQLNGRKYARSCANSII